MGIISYKFNSIEVVVRERSVWILTSAMSHLRDQAGTRVCASQSAKFRPFLCEGITGSDKRKVSPYLPPKIAVPTRTMVLPA